ncbi:hypothetical protein [Spongiactinospora rosea]|uniref:hypothetical protein n=1 Tax=Spongiactinospora rosea TaxID=2248750 RepID=UPI0013143B6B|nr:hypothetical protein [Spongiactinospora rosea]
MAAIPSAIGKAAGLVDGARSMLAAAPSRFASYRPLVEELDVAALEGPILVHADLHAGNLLIDDIGRVRAVDWSMDARARPGSMSRCWFRE